MTCAVTRGVHIEILKGQSAGDVWTGLRRVFARRGRPVLIYSDNGTSFHRVAKDLQHLHGCLKKVHEEEQELFGMEWRFSAPLSPWQGGFFERMIGTFKKHLSSLNHHQPIPETEMVTLTMEIEAVMNSRPIGVLQDGSVLTPASFWKGSRLISLPQYTAKTDESIPSSLKAYLTRQRSLNAFWRAWRRSYLTSLHDRLCRTGNTVSLKKGMKVLIHDDNVKRNQWSVGTVVEEIKGRDERSRVFKVELNGKIMTRALQRLSPFEINFEGEDVGPPISVDESDPTVEPGEGEESRTHRRGVRKKQAQAYES